MKAILLSLLFVLTSVSVQAELNIIRIKKENQKNIKNSELISIVNNALHSLELEDIYYGIDKIMNEIKIIAVYKSEQNKLVQIDLQGRAIVSGVDKEFGDPVFEDEETNCYVSIYFNGDSKEVVEAGCEVGSWISEY